MFTCFFCGESATNLKKFTEEKLEKCRRIQVLRKKKNLCHKDVVLPKSWQQGGFHLQCYMKFITLKSNNRKEFSSLSNGKILINIPPLKVVPSNTFNGPSSSIGMEIPDFEDRKCDIEVKVSPLTYHVDEPSYVNPDISKGVILKSILTMKTPIKKELLDDPLAFNSGMDLLRYGPFNQQNFNFGEEKVDPKIIETFSLANVCLFCDKEQRKIGTEFELSDIAKEDECKKILEFAKEIDDKVLLGKLDSNKIFPFHPLCRVEYKNKYQKITKKNCDEDDWLVIENLQSKAFEALCSFIDDKIIDNNKTYLLTDLFDRYKAMLIEIQNTSTPVHVDSFSIQDLQDKILNHYFGTVKINSINKCQKKKVVYKNGQTNLKSAFVEHENFTFDNLAFELRSEIKSLKRRSSKSDSEIPEKLVSFVTSLIKGPNAGKNSYEDSMKIESVCQDIVAKINVDD